MSDLLAVVTRFPHCAKLSPELGLSATLCPLLLHAKNRRKVLQVVSV